MTLIVANVNISNDIYLADFDFHVLITCGKKVMDEINPADIPKISVAFIANCLFILRQTSKNKFAIGR